VDSLIFPVTVFHHPSRIPQNQKDDFLQVEIIPTYTSEIITYLVRITANFLLEATNAPELGGVGRDQHQPLAMPQPADEYVTYAHGLALLLERSSYTAAAWASASSNGNVVMLPRRACSIGASLRARSAYSRHPKLDLHTGNTGMTMRPGGVL